MIRLSVFAIAALAAACSHPDPTPIAAEPAAPEPIVNMQPQHDKPAGMTARIGPDAADAMGIGADQDCFTLYYDYAGTQDWRAARACFARAVEREGGCKGESPSLERLYLATMAVDGQGGPALRDHGYLEGCFADASVEPLKELSSAKPSGKLDYCRDLLGTTWSSDQCSQMLVRQSEAGERKLLSQLAAQYGHADLMQMASVASRRLGGAEARWVSDAYRGGSMKSVVLGHHFMHRTELRIVLLREILAGKVEPASGDEDVEGAYAAESRKRYDAAGRRLLVESQRAWKRYLQAELAWVRAAGGPVAAVELRLKGERAQILREGREP